MAVFKNVERLLKALEQSPEQAADLVVAALGARGWSDVATSLTEDPRFVCWLLPAFRDARIRKEIPYLSRVIAQKGLHSAIGDLLAVWREDEGASAENAGFALLDIGDQRSLAAVADDALERSGPALQCCFRAAFALHPQTEAYNRLAGHLENDDFAGSLFVFLSNNTELARKDPRWQRVAADALASRTPKVARGARRALETLGATDAIRCAESQRPTHPPVAPAEISASQAIQARRRVDRALRRLADSGFALIAPPEPSVLAELESLVGPLPPAVRAFYETCDGIRVEANRRLEIYPISVALKAARRWMRVESPGRESADLVRPFELPVAPDAYTLRGLSGGPDVAVAYPWVSPDPKLLHTPRSPRFSTLVVRALKAAT